MITSNDTIRFETRTASDMTDDERTALVALLSAAYEEPFDFVFEWFPGALHTLMYEGDTLIGHACLVRRWLQPGELPPLPTAYVEAVAIAPEHQGKGHGKRLMLEIQRQIEADPDIQLAALSPAVPQFYLDLGWVWWRGETFIRTDDGLTATPDEEIMIMRVANTPPLDLHAPISAEWRVGELW